MTLNTNKIRLLASFKTLLVSCVIGLGTFLVCGSSYAQPSRIELPRVFADFAINPETGSVCAVDSKGGEVVVLFSGYFDGNDKELAEPIPVGKNPNAVTWKKVGDRSFFVVACLNDKHLYLIDADMNEFVKKIPVEISHTLSMASSSNPEDPLLFYGDHLATRVLNLRTMADSGVVLEGGGDAQVSPDGTLLYRSALQGRGVEVTQRGDDATTGELSFFEVYRSGGAAIQHLIDPDGEFVIRDQTVYTKSLANEIARLEGKPAIAMSNRPMLVCYSDSQDAMRVRNKDKLKLFCVSTNNFKTIGKEVDLTELLDLNNQPRNMRGKQSMRTRSIGRERFLVDENNGRVYVAEGKRLLKVDLDNFELPGELKLNIVERDFDLFVGEQVSMDLATRHPETQLKIDSLPEGASLVGKQLTWNPNRLQVGRSSIKVRLINGESERVQFLNFFIEFPSIALPEECTHISLSPSKSEAVIWQGRISVNNRWVVPDGLPKLFLVDLNDQRLLAEKEMSYQLENCTVDDHYIYIQSTEGNGCDVCKKDTLEVVKTLYSNSGGKTIVTDNELLKLGDQTYLLPSLKPTSINVELESLEKLWKFQHLAVNVVGRRAQSQVQDRKLAEQQAAMKLQSEANTGVPLESVNASIKFWSERQAIRPHDRSATYTDRVVLEVVDTDKEKQLLNLEMSKDTQPFPLKNLKPFRNKPVPFVEQGDLIWGLAGNRLFRWNAKTLYDELPDLVPRMEYDGKKLVMLNETSEPKIELKFSGGTGVKRVSLLGQVQFYEAQGDNIVIHRDQLFEHCRETSLKAFEQLQTHQFNMARNAIKEYVAELEPSFQRVFGNEFNGIPVALDIKVRAVDEKSQLADFTINVVVVLKKRTILGLLNQVQESRTQQKREQDARIEQIRQQQRDRIAAAKDPDGLKQLEGKIEQLNSRVDELNQKMAEILKALKEKK